MHFLWDVKRREDSDARAGGAADQMECSGASSEERA